MPKLTRVAGFEIGSGFYINPTRPRTPRSSCADVDARRPESAATPLMSSARLSIAHVASEMAPFAKVGGLADVVGALAAEQARRGHRVVVAIPRYARPGAAAGLERRALGEREVPWGMGHEPARFDHADGPPGQPRVLLVDHAGERRFFDRPGIYDDPRTRRGLSGQRRALPVLHARRARRPQAASANRSTSCTRTITRRRGRRASCARTMVEERVSPHRHRVHHPQSRLPGHLRSVGAGARRASAAQCVLSATARSSTGAASTS